MTLTDFLLARIAGDEAVAGEAKRDHYSVDGGLRYGEVGYETLPDLTINPARVLAECEAKRRIVAQWDMCQPPASGADYAVEQELELVLMALALPYADHPDYREEWRP